MDDDPFDLDSIGTFDSSGAFCALKVFNFENRNIFPLWNRYIFACFECENVLTLLTTSMFRLGSQFTTGTIGYDGDDWRDGYDMILFWPQSK